MRFLEEVVEIVLRKYATETDAVTIVFPNRRAGLFFQKYLSEKITSPIWSPEIISIEDFIKSLSNLQSADKLDLIFELYKVFKKLNKSDENFDKFFYWGNIMLQDFDELDKFLVDPELLFKNLIHVKNLENNLDYLQEEQKNIIMEFWESFGEKLSSHQKGFLGIWDNLFQTYSQFKSRLYEIGIAYNGMIYREVSENLESGDISLTGHLSSETKQAGKKYKNVIFAGFNALSKSEEKIISWFVKEGKGMVVWDADDHYLKDNKQEGGKFLREMKYGNSILRNSFRESYGNSFATGEKKIEVISVASDVGQAQHASDILKSLGSQTNLDEKTAVVLPNNELLFPLLHALPEDIELLNITMGYPLSSSTIFGFLDALINLQIKSENKNAFHFRPLLTILRHPLLAKACDNSIIEISNNIIKKNIIWVSKKLFNVEHDLVRTIIKEPTTGLSEYILDIIGLLAQQNDDEIEKEFLFHFYKLVNKLNDFILHNQIEISKIAFQKLFKQLVQGERLPFEGEPLLGLQVMGILETRNLDFDNLIVLSMNESLIPPAAKNTSFIPYSIRKVFNLPVTDHQDAMYAYIFYRLVQRAKNIYFIFNSTEETGKSGEVSRFIRQLQHETNLDISFKTLSTNAYVEDPHIITINKTESVLESLAAYTSKKDFKNKFTPSALNSYLDCRLRFYFRYILGLKEHDDVLEKVDPRVFGNLLHEILEQLYKPFDIDGKRTVSEEDISILKKRVDAKINEAFIKNFGSEEKIFTFEGHNILAKEIIKKMVLKVLDFDNKRTPFEILGLEADERKGFVLYSEIQINGKSTLVGMKGILDRIEQKEGVIRIVDYKTGQDKNNFTDIESLFDRNNKSRNKAVFQTFFYGLLYSSSPNANPSSPIQAGLFNIRELFNESFSPLIRQKNGNTYDIVKDLKGQMSAFEIELSKLLEEIYNPDVAFDQTDDNKKCGYCPYAGICNR